MRSLLAKFFAKLFDLGRLLAHRSLNKPATPPVLTGYAHQGGCFVFGKRRGV